MTITETFAIFAHGTYWGNWSGADAAAAIQAAADEVGTDGNTDGLTAHIVSEGTVEALEKWKDAGCLALNQQQRRVLKAEFHGTMPAIISTAGLASHDPFIDVIDPTTNAPMRCWLNTADHPERVTSNIYLD